MPNTRTRLGVSAWAIGVFFVMLGSNGVRSLIGWPGYLITAGALLAIGIGLLIKYRPRRFKWYRVPKPLFLFLLLAALSIAWSAYPLESVLGVAAQLATTGAGVCLAIVLSWQEILRTFASAMRYLLAASLLFELFVSLFIQHPVLQGFVDVPDPDNISKLLYWSRDLLFSGGPIQGIVANSALLGFIALLALIAFSVQLRGGLVAPINGWFWVVIAVGTLLLTRAATVWVALIAVIISLGFALWTRRVGERRMPVYTVGAIGLIGTAVLALTARSFLLPLLGKSGTLTGRLEIWQKVTELASERPWFGLGWISYWAPWVEPYKSLDTKVGLPVMHAHNAWLDVWLQLGIIGLVFFVVLALMTLQRVWCRAVDAPRRGSGPPLPYATSTLLPWLVMCALMVQSLTESRLLVEGDWVLFIMFAVKTRIDYELPSREDEPPRIPWRHVPIIREDSLRLIVDEPHSQPFTRHRAQTLLQLRQYSQDTRGSDSDATNHP
jgi:exopolysaccharide production protein ExoQ